MVKLCPPLSPNTKKKYPLKTRMNIGPFRTSPYRRPLARIHFLVLLGMVEVGSEGPRKRTS